LEKKYKFIVTYKSRQNIMFSHNFSFLKMSKIQLFEIQKHKKFAKCTITKFMQIFDKHMIGQQAWCSHKMGDTNFARK